mgnify:CR=1 FL=1
MKKMIKLATAAMLMALPAGGQVAAQNTSVDWDIVTKIRDEGFNRSKVMETVQYLTDVIGPRLSGSPQMQQASEWTRDTLAAWGMDNARLEGFEFGPGWSSEHTVVKMTSPRTSQLYARAMSWHPGTDGVVNGDVVYAPMSSKADFEKYKGTLKGKIVMVDKVRPQREPSNQVFTRRSDEEIANRLDFSIPTGEAEDPMKWWSNYLGFFHEREQFLRSEGALVMVRNSPRNAMLLDANAYQHATGMNAEIPAVGMAAEHYNRLKRLIDLDKTVSLSVEVKAQFHTEDTKTYNTLADIDGETDEVVLVGAHLDSWHLGDGAVDNAAGSAVAMEAMRIIKTLGVKPKRTIRIGLWSGEEQGYFGSQAYVLDHLVSRPQSDNERYKYAGTYEKHYNMFPMEKKPSYNKFSAYYNLDNGSGKIRGIYAEQNSAAGHIFKSWLEPFHDLGAKHVTLNDTGGTDHEPFDDIGLPGFQFMQDSLDYSTRLHHTQVDTYDHVYEKDLKQAAVIMASFLWHTAQMDTLMPREPEPKKVTYQ